MIISRFNKKNTEKDLYDFFVKKYNISWLEKDYFKYVDTENYISITNKEWQEIDSLARIINNIYLKSYKYYIKEVDKLLENFWELKKIIKKRYFKKDHFIARYDIIIDEKTGKFKFIENNANTPWMITDIYHVTNILTGKKNDIIINNVERIFSNFKEKKIWILLTHSFENEDYLTWLDYKDMISKIIPEENIILWDIYESNIVNDRFFTIKWKKVDVLLNFFPIEFFLTDIDYRIRFWNLIENNFLKMYNPFSSIVFQDKIMSAIIWENLDKFTKKEQKIIKDHIPFTKRNYNVWDEEKFIAKIRFWRYSQNIFTKNFYLNIENEDDYIFQERIEYKKINWQYLVLWLYHNFTENLCLIWRTSKEFLLNDEESKVILCVCKW